VSLGIVIKSPEGLVLAAESRVTLTTTLQNGQQMHTNFDNATKLVSFSPPNCSVGAVTYGQAAIGIRTVNSFLPEFEANLPSDPLPVAEFSRRLSDFFLSQWNAVVPQNYQGPNITFVVGGFDTGEPYGKVFLFEIPGAPNPLEQQANDFGITWGGQREIVDRLIQGFDSRLATILQQSLKLDQAAIDSTMKAFSPLSLPIPLQFMGLQDHVNLALFFIETTIAAQTLTLGIRGCGGPIDVATITRREGLRFIQRKEVKGRLDPTDR
jgi:hypothetical protein